MHHEALSERSLDTMQSHQLETSVVHAVSVDSAFMTSARDACRKTACSNVEVDLEERALNYRHVGGTLSRGEKQRCCIDELLQRGIMHLHPLAHKPSTASSRLVEQVPGAAPLPVHALACSLPPPPFRTHTHASLLVVPSCRRGQITLPHHSALRLRRDGE